MSTSYPYLTVARKFGVPYSLVLGVVEELEKAPKGMPQLYLIWHAPEEMKARDAVALLDATTAAFKSEQQRRTG